jgi:hypothetical protein
MIPIPGASFVYSLLKDVGSWGLTRLRERRFSHVFQGWTVDQWCRPDLAIEEFGNQDWVRARKEAEQRRKEARVTLDELDLYLGEPEDREIYELYEDLERTAEIFTDILC